MRFKNIFFSCLFGLIYSLTLAQELPPIQVFTPKTYNAENQNWAISQSDDKHIFVANNKGLLEFNGSKWQLYPSPNKTILRSVHVVEDKIYTGSYMEFGFWQKNQLGQLKYTSLSSKIAKLVEDEQFWKIINFRHWVLFQSLNKIYIYNTQNDTFKTIDSENRIPKIHQINDEIYFQKINEGLFKIVNGESEIISNNVLFKDNLIVDIYKDGDKLLILTDTKGFFTFKNNELNKWNIPADNILENKTVYSSIQLKDKSLLLGTISNGIIHLTKGGNLNYHINQNSGLSNNTVLSAFQDVENNIWLGLDNGINCVNINSPFRIYNDDKGKLGTLYDSATHNGFLYLGTNQGLFCKKLNTNDDFKFVEGTKGQVWCLNIIDDTLFCGHNNGTFIIKEASANLIANIQGVWDIKPIENEPNLLLQGNYNGLNILEKNNGNWAFRNKIEGFNNSSRYFDFLNKNHVFVSHEYKGVFNLEIDNTYKNAIQVVKDTSVEKGYNSSLIKYNNKILYTYKNGIHSYGLNTESFTKDTILSKLFSPEDYTSGKLVYNAKKNKLWSFSNKEISYLTPGKLSNKPEINRIPLPNALRKNMTGYENISHIDNQNFLFGTSSGYVIIDLSKIKSRPYAVTINSAIVSDIKTPFKEINLEEDGVFETNQNNVKFSYNVVEYYKYIEAEYQYQLEGMYDNWSNWSSESSHLFENLPYGDYTFNVKARVGNDTATNIASYSFIIERPWYLSNLMIALYVLMFILFSSILHLVYKNYYKKQREKLLLKTKRELALKELENEQQLMSFNNENLKRDIENKNRELAISTMSLIKKNEFLNNIKDELTKSKDNKSLSSVIKIIDKNLNNTDDWKFFQEAFNNADKDFLKKVKSKHPKLTPNDLRLCAYLRLNLSSKEIAPLLNISSRSVEVKRYRLRKKMNLPHETSLTNYILEL